MSPSPDSTTRGPYPCRRASCQIGRYMAFSWISCWMRWRIASRFFLRLRRDAAVPLERELDVVGRDGLVVVGLDPFAQHELIDEPVGRHAPRLGQAGRHALPRHRLEEGVMQRVEKHEGRDES